VPVEISVAEKAAMGIAGNSQKTGYESRQARAGEIRCDDKSRRGDSTTAPGADIEAGEKKGRRRDATTAPGADVETGESTSANRGPGDQSGRKRKKERVRDAAHHRCPKKEMATTGGDSQSMPTLRL
jgi:hypothetical protein